MKFMKKFVCAMFCLLVLWSCNDKEKIVTVDMDDPIVNTTTPCKAGFADKYPCNGYDLLINIPLNELVSGLANDIWGWTDPEGGAEYAIVGLDVGTAFIKINDGYNAEYLGKLPTATQVIAWRDVKVYNNHAFIVSEAAGHGMQVFDLTRLRAVENAPVTFTADALYNGIGKAHNLFINEATGFAYVVGTDRSDIYGGGVHFIDVNDPLNPIAAGGHGESGYSHDVQVLVYDGPDMDYIAREILVGSNENKVAIVDVTDKNNPVEISTISYSDTGYTHQGWFTDDQRYFIAGDELDEQESQLNTRSLVFDFSDLDNPVLHMSYMGPTKAIDHNGYVKEKLFYLANYTAGLRVIDISKIDMNEMTEVGYFDTYPSDNATTFNGVWSVYPYFKSGAICISDINEGFFIVKKSE